jgi:DHA2 family multidrug resistance protein
METALQLERPTGLRRVVIVATAITAAVMELIDTSIVNVALNEIAGNLGATIEDVAWVVTGYAIANVIVIPLSGFLARYFGRKNYFFYSIILFTVASYFCGRADNIWALVLWRFVQGLGGGGLLSTAQGILFDSFEPKDRPVASAIFGMGIVLGPTFGPTAGGYIVDHYSWPLIFDVNIPIGIAAALLTYAFLPKQPNEYNIDRKAIHIDWTGIALLSVGVGALQWVLERGESKDWFQSQEIIIATLLTVVGLVGFVWYELRIPNPAVNLRVFKNRTLALSTILIFVVGLGLFSSVFLFPVLVQRTMYYTPTMTGLTLLPGTIGSLFLFPLIGRSIQRGVPPRFFVYAGYFIFIAFNVMMARVDINAAPGDFFWPLIIRGCGLAMVNLPLINQAVADLKPQEYPAGIALTNMMRQLGGAFGIAIVNTYVANRTAVHRTDLVSNVTAENPLATERLNQLAQGLIARGFDAAKAAQQAYASLDAAITRQALLISYLDAFYFVTALFVCTFPLIFLLKNPPKTKEQQAAARAAAAESH